MYKIDRDVDSQLADNTWKIEFQEWIAELNEKRLKWIEDIGEVDEFANYARHWGEINGLLAADYLELLQEIKKINLQLYSKYRNKAVEILEFFDFTDITENQYLEFKATGTIKELEQINENIKDSLVTFNV